MITTPLRGAARVLSSFMDDTTTLDTSAVPVNGAPASTYSSTTISMSWRSLAEADGSSFLWSRAEERGASDQ